MKEKKKKTFSAGYGSFWLTFPNGTSISTQFKGGNYCENHDNIKDMIRPISQFDRIDCNDCELAILGTDKEFITNEVLGKHFNGLDDNIIGRVRLDDWLKIVEIVKKYDEGLKNGD